MAGFVWHRSDLTERIQTWAEENGRPPSATDWSPALARQSGRPDRAEKWELEGCWPSVTAVVYAFGSWSNGLAEAGYECNPSGRPVARR